MLAAGLLHLHFGSIAFSVSFVTKWKRERRWEGKRGERKEKGRKTGRSEGMIEKDG